MAAKDDGWLAPITNTLDYTLQQIQTGLDQLHVPYSYGWAIITLTLATKIATFPFTKIQVRVRQCPSRAAWDCKDSYTCLHKNSGLLGYIIHINDKHG